MTQPIDPALVAEMIKVCRTLAALVGQTMAGQFFVDGRTVEDARAIVAELPEPVNPDLLLAREVVCQAREDDDTLRYYSFDLAAGKHDDTQPVRIALAAIKRVRQEEAR